MCPGTYIPRSEIEAYTAKAVAEKLIDQQARDIDIGKAHIGIGVVHRGKLTRRRRTRWPSTIRSARSTTSSTARRRSSPARTSSAMKRRPATLETVRLFNGPGNNGIDVRNGVAHELKAGDVIVIPAGTGHWFTKIDDHINYLMVRIDPDKVTPLKNEADSKAYLAKPHQP